MVEPEHAPVFAPQVVGIEVPVVVGPRHELRLDETLGPRTARDGTVPECESFTSADGMRAGTQRGTVGTCGRGLERARDVVAREGWCRIGIVERLGKGVVLFDVERCKRRLKRNRLRPREPHPTHIEPCPLHQRDLIVVVTEQNGQVIVRIAATHRHECNEVPCVLVVDAEVARDVVGCDDATLAREARHKRDELACDGDAADTAGARTGVVLRGVVPRLRAGKRRE